MNLLIPVGELGGKLIFKKQSQPVYRRLQQINFAEQQFHPKHEPRSFVNTSRNTSHAFTQCSFFIKTVLWGHF